MKTRLIIAASKENSMKKVISVCQTQTFIVLLSLLILMMAFGFNAHAAKLGLASAWLFEDNGGKVVKDVVGGHDGDIKGSLEWVNNGKFGGALEFPGKGDSYVRVDHDDVFNSDPYTFVAWVKLEAKSWQYIVWRNGDVWPEPEEVRHLDIWIHDADYPVFMWNAEQGQGRINGETIIADGEWHHIAKVYDGKNVQMFIDGKLDGEDASGGKLVTNESPIWIGARPGNVAATGLFDEVGFFTEALSEDELNDVIDNGLAGYAAVEATGKATTTWAFLKTKK